MKTNPLIFVKKITKFQNRPFCNGKPQQLSLSEKISLGGLLIALVTIPISVVTPEIRCRIGLPSELCPGSITSKAEDFYQKGSALLKLGRYAEALDYFNQAIDLDSSLAKAWNGRGLALEKLSKNQQALASYEKALLLDSNYEIARQNREALLLKQKLLRSQIHRVD